MSGPWWQRGGRPKGGGGRLDSMWLCVAQLGDVRTSLSLNSLDPSEVAYYSFGLAPKLFTSCHAGQSALLGMRTDLVQKKVHKSNKGRRRSSWHLDWFINERTLAPSPEPKRSLPGDAHPSSAPSLPLYSRLFFSVTLANPCLEWPWLQWPVGPSIIIDKRAVPISPSSQPPTSPHGVKHASNEPCRTSRPGPLEPAAVALTASPRLSSGQGRAEASKNPLGTSAARRVPPKLSGASLPSRTPGIQLPQGYTSRLQ